MEKAPGIIVMIGAGVPDQTKWVGQHNPNIMFNEAVLPFEAALYAQMAVNFLEK